jgi:hypothetical protein
MARYTWDGAIKQAFVVRQQLTKHVSTASNMHAAIEELLEAAFSVWSVPRLYNKEQLPYESVLSRQLVSAVRKL